MDYILFRAGRFVTPNLASINRTEIGSTGIGLRMTSFVVDKGGFFSLSKSKAVLELNDFSVLSKDMFCYDHTYSVVDNVLGYIDKKGDWKPHYSTVLAWLNSLKFSSVETNKEFKALIENMSKKSTEYLCDNENQEKALSGIASVCLILPGIQIYWGNSGYNQQDVKGKKLKPGKVYLIGSKAAGILKIGFTTDIKKRFQDLQQNNPYDLEILKVKKGSLDTERILLKKFKHLKLRGEWFKWDNEIIDNF